MENGYKRKERLKKEIEQVEQWPDGPEKAAQLAELHKKLEDL